MANKYPEALRKYYEQNPEKHREYGKLANPDKIRKTLLKKGIKPPSRKGTKASKETRLKMSLARKGKPAPWMKGRKPSERQRQIAKITVLKTRKKVASRGKLTDIEKIVDEYLHLNNIKHEHEYYIEGKAVDFYLPTERTIFEADGKYWHRDIKKDIERDLFIKSNMKNTKIIHLTEKSIKDGSWVNIWGARRKV